MKHLQWWKVWNLRKSSPAEGSGSPGEGRGFIAQPYFLSTFCFLTTDIEWPAHPSYVLSSSEWTPSLLQPWVRPFLKLLSWKERWWTRYPKKSTWWWAAKSQSLSACLANCHTFQYFCFNLPGPFQLKLFHMTLHLGKSPPRARLGFSFQDPSLILSTGLSQISLPLFLRSGLCV